MDIASRLEAIEEHLSDAYDSIEAKGANLHLLPSEYTQVDYIESSGTQYIDTGINADNKLDIKYTLEKISSITSGAIYNDNGSYKRYHIGTNNSKYSFYVLTNNAFGTIADDTNVKHDFYIKATNRTVETDRVSYELPEASVSDTELNFWLFRRNSNVANLRNFAIFRLYSCLMYYNNVLVRQFVPCYRNSDNEVGLYDLVNNVFYTNQGTGVFTYGEVKEDYAFAKNISNLSRAINLIPTN